VVAAALGIHRVLNAQMAEGIRLVSVRQGIDPRAFALVPLGGAGGIHAVALAQELNMTRIVIPRIPGVLAAAGLLAAPTEHEVSVAFSMPIDDVVMEALHEQILKIDHQASLLMQAEGPEKDAVSTHYFADVCYIGQSYNLEIPLHLDDAAPMQRLYQDFLETHGRVYGHSVRGPAKIVNLRTVHQAGGAEVIEEMRQVVAGAGARLVDREIHVAGGTDAIKAKVYQRDSLEPGLRFAGPAIIQQADTTSIIHPGWLAVVDDFGNINLMRERESPS
jgi:N-methylhydantoinase A